MENIESMPRPEILLVADTVAREKNIDREDVFVAMEVAIHSAYDWISLELTEEELELLGK